MPPTDTEIAWAAGLFEGEGYAGHRQRPRTAIRLSLEMTDHDVVMRFFDIVGVGNVTLRRGPIREALIAERRWKPSWVWTTSKREDVDYVIGLIRPYLGERRTARINELVERRSNAATLTNTSGSRCIR